MIQNARLGDYQQPLCFVLPAANSVGTMNMHQQFREHVVLPGDRFINVFPKHQEELAQVSRLAMIRNPARCGCYFLQSLFGRNEGADESMSHVEAAVLHGDPH